MDEIPQNIVTWNVLLFGYPQDRSGCARVHRLLPDTNVTYDKYSWKLGRQSHRDYKLLIYRYNQIPLQEKVSLHPILDHLIGSLRSKRQREEWQWQPSKRGWHTFPQNWASGRMWLGRRESDGTALYCRFSPCSSISWSSYGWKIKSQRGIWKLTSNPVQWDCHSEIVPALNAPCPHLSQLDQVLKTAFPLNSILYQSCLLALVAKKQNNKKAENRQIAERPKKFHL